MNNVLNFLTPDEIDHITLGLTKEKPVIVGMSGGVDSSVTAAILHNLGYNVLGVTLQLHSNDKKCCSSIKDVIEAKDIATTIGIQHHAINYVDKFNNTVMKNFIDEYSSGTTPSPCVRCNQYIKFDELLSFAISMGAQAIATGHYIMHKFVNDHITFCRANDANKDQTYFMSMIKLQYMQFIRFPIGCMVKSRVRELAKYMGLAVATKKDSQDLCFIQNGTYRDILSELAKKTNEGLIIDKEGAVLGRHNGIHNYTVGQRKGLNLSNGPWFVLEIDADKNEILVGQYEDLFKSEFTVHDMNILNDAIHNDIFVKIRARHDPVACVVHKMQDNTGNEVVAPNENYDKYKDEDSIYCAKNNALWIVKLKEPTYAITPGQICAFYSNDILVGGARITNQPITMAN